MKRPVIVANGGANAASLQYALERLGAQARVSAEARQIEQASHILLPGVGSAPDAMRRLAGADLDELIPGLTQPVLGICLGMQLLYERSEEDDTPCLGIFAGRVRRLERAIGRAVPHMGWNRLHPVGEHALLDGIRSGDFAYFMHSFAVAPGPEAVAVSDYGMEFAAIVSRGNFHGAQFHPERSAKLGATLLANFLELV
ncbi:MAG: imidazole glycerol phosphate synthase subunit HisH [Steroidobacteraceae bacterium]